MFRLWPFLIRYNYFGCSYCTPGFVMGMNAYLSQTQADPPDLVDIENIFDGHCKLLKPMGWFPYWGELCTNVFIIVLTK